MRAVVGSGESVLAIVDVMDLGVLRADVMVEEVEVAMTDYLEPRKGSPTTSFTLSSTSGSPVNFE